MNILFVDTETTGLVKHKLPASHQSQPHIVQIAAIMSRNDSDFTDLVTYSTIIRPEGYDHIEQGAVDTHGISFERAMDEGIPIGQAMDILNTLGAASRLWVSHNVAFDYKVCEAAFIRLGWEHKLPAETRCTMQSSTDLCKLPGRYGYKWPRLEELHHFLFQESFEGAHDALNDIRATKRCFHVLVQNGTIRMPG